MTLSGAGLRTHLYLCSPGTKGMFMFAGSLSTSQQVGFSRRVEEVAEEVRTWQALDGLGFDEPLNILLAGLRYNWRGDRQA